MQTPRLHALITSLARALQSEQRGMALAAGLLPVQWAILCYLRDANRYSNTPQAVAEYLALTKGTVSQTLKLIESHGWIARAADAADRRVVRLFLSEAGRDLLDDASDRAWSEAIEGLPQAQRDAAEAVLARLLAGWQQSRAGRTFGVCRDCAHFRAGEAEHECGLTGEALSEDDSRHICREHRQPDAPARPTPR
ncbi:MAG: winged helix-turn-helix transcriptional regulator [Betaproteobacteria bacterium]|nr:winged helix-turn-helix transcriptional regulator [Betaproteobacteria bacterium]